MPQVGGGGMKKPLVCVTKSRCPVTSSDRGLHLLDHMV
jgi:hypothetical protein